MSGYSYKMEKTLKNDIIPVFSVIMPCYNAESYIAQSIESVLNQTFTRLELIVIDDASQDDSLEIIKSFSRLDSRVKFISLTENMGAAFARNSAIQISKGSWIAMLDADDLFMPNKLEAQYEIIKNSRSDLILVGSGCYHIDSHGNNNKEFRYSKYSKLLKFNLHNMLKFPPHSSLVYSSSAIKEIGGFNSRFILAEDYDLWLRLADIGSFKCSDELLIKYREHSENISNKIFKGQGSLLTYSLSARVCQMCRHDNFLDPSSMNDSKEWIKLTEYVVEFIKDSKYESYILWKKNLKSSIESDVNTASWLYNILSKHFSPVFIFMLLKEKYLNLSNISVKRIYKLWIKEMAK